MKSPSPVQGRHLPEPDYVAPTELGDLVGYEHRRNEACHPTPSKGKMTTNEPGTKANLHEPTKVQKANSR